MVVILICVMILAFFDFLANFSEGELGRSVITFIIFAYLVYVAIKFY